MSETKVSIAMGTGTDVAMQSASITVVKGDLRGIAKAIRLSRATMGTSGRTCFRVPLQRAGYSRGGGGALSVFRLAAQPDHCRRRDEPEFRLGHQHRLAAAERESVIELRTMKTHTPTNL